MTDFNQKTHDTDVGSHGGQSRQMMEVFENQEFGSIRLLQEAGKTFFCASDVAKALGYVNPYAAVKRHCRGPLTKREGVVQKVNQYGDAGEQVVEIFIAFPAGSRAEKITVPTDMTTDMISAAPEKVKERSKVTCIIIARTSTFSSSI